MGGNPQLQAEAVQSLSCAAKDRNMALQMCTPQVFVVFRNLLQILCFSIAEPLTRLLCCLALHPASQDSFLLLPRGQLLQSLAASPESDLTIAALCVCEYPPRGT